MRIETERLVLRPMGMDDLDALVALQAAPEVVRFFDPYTRARGLERLQEDERQWRERGHGLLAVTDRSNGQFLGRVGLRHRPEWDEVAVGWVLRPDFWGRGLATEAARACVAWGFDALDVPYLIALIEPANARSIRVAERLGMSPARREFQFGRDMVVYLVGREGEHGPYAGTGATAAGSIGSETTKLVPCPGSDSTEIVPPLPSTNPLAMASPRPDPVHGSIPGVEPR